MYFYTFLAAGVWILLIWIIRRLANRSKFQLINTPGRPNSLTPLHIFMMLLGYLIINSVAYWAIAQWLGQKSPSLVAIISIPGQIFLIVASLIVAKYTFRAGIQRGLGLSARRWLANGLRGVLALAAVLPVIWGLHWVIQQVFPPGWQQLHPVLENLPKINIGWKITAIFSVVVLAPLAEEIFFRGLFQSMLRSFTQRPWVSVLVTAAFFGIVHYNSPQDVLPLFVFGITLGYNYERTGRLFAPIMMHAMFNSIMIWYQMANPGG